MSLATEPYLDQAALWPKTGRPILAQFDDASVVVYQAFRPSIEDVSDLVAEQRAHVEARRYDLLVTPRERVYPVLDAAVARQIGIALAPS